MSKPHVQPIEDQLLRVIDFAGILRVSKRKAFEILQSGEIPVVRVGKRCPRIRASDARAWIESRRK